jgi:hypothetical protein
MKKLAFCGLDCNACPAYIATQSEERAGLERVAELWREQFGVQDLTADSIICDGCTSGARTAAYCLVCRIRACATGREVENCGHCKEYPCATLDEFLASNPQARTELALVRGAV